MPYRTISLGPGILVSATSLSAQQATYTLKPTPKTVAWGYYDAKAAPVLRVKSGDTVEIQTLITNSPKRLEDAGLPSLSSAPSVISAASVSSALNLFPFFRPDRALPSPHADKPAGEGKAIHSFGGFDFLLAAPKKDKN